MDGEGAATDTTEESIDGSGGEPPAPAPIVRAVLVIAGALALAAVVGAQFWQLGQPRLPGRQEAEPVTGFVAGPLELLAAVASIGTVGSLLAAAWGYRRPDRDHGWKLGGPQYAAMTAARRWSVAWAVAGVVLVPVNAADTSGVPLSYVFGAFGDFLSADQTAQAWLLTAVLAALIALGCWLTTTWRWAVGLTVAAVLATLPTVVTAQVSVGAGHDLATDAAIVFTLLTVLWFGASWSLRRTAAVIGGLTAVRRIQRIGLVAVVVALTARLWIAHFELAGRSVFTSAYGIGILALFGLLLVLGLRLLVGVIRRRRSADPVPRQVAGAGIDVALVVLVLGVQAALLRLVPPRYLARQSPAENYLGYDLPTAPTVTDVLLPGRPNILLFVTSLVMIGLYLWGVLRLRRAGDRWPMGRTIAWIIGWLIVIVLISTRMWTYSSATFSWHMVVHMTLNMGAPVPMVLGGPVTLLLRATRGHPAGRPVGLHEVVTRLLNWRVTQAVLHPVVVWLLFVGSLYLLYLTPLFGLLMRYHWAHQLMLVHFLVTGYLFYWMVIGVDRLAQPLPHIAKLGYVFAAMPVHAFFAVAVLSGGAIIGHNFYVSLDLGWLTDLEAQQRTGGQVTWATGEIPLFIVIVALVGQWFAQDQREARRTDRAADAGLDDSLTAYNEMLAALSARDHATGNPRQHTEVPADQDRQAGERS